MSISLLSLAILLVAAPPAETPSGSTETLSKEMAAEPFHQMKEAAKTVKAHDKRDGQPVELRLLERPIHRYSGQPRDSNVGTVWAWTSAGRPLALLALEGRNSRRMAYELVSLQTNPISFVLEGQRNWTSRKPGLVLKPLPAAPTPANTKAKRLLQMTKLARRFTAYEIWGKHYKLQLLPEPVHQWFNLDMDQSDGAIFFYVHGTNPEVVGLIECRRDASGSPIWYYGFVPLGAAQLFVHLDDDNIWTNRGGRQRAYTNGVFRAPRAAIDATRPSAPKIPKRHWEPEQATGAPDTHQAGDIPTAWASLTPDNQAEWLLLTYAAPIKPMAIHVYETYNPGALARVTVFGPDRQEMEVWKGKDPSEPGSGMGISKIPLDQAKVTFPITRVKLYLDSPSVRGWNEIDAVGLMDHSGKLHWATKAEASSTYAQRQRRSSAPPPPEVKIPRRAVKLSHGDDSADGKRSLGGSGHAIAFDRPETVKYVCTVQIFASRYGRYQPPDEDFHVYLLDADKKPIKDLTYPYAMIQRGAERWYTLKVPMVEVPERFHVAPSFNPHQTKGIYLGLDKDVEESHSYTGLPSRGYKPVGEAYDWMVRVYLVADADASEKEAPTGPP